MTKTQIKKLLQKTLDKIDDLISDLEEAENEATKTADSIEPYEGKDDLTPQQEERQEWFENLASVLTDAKDELDSRRYEIESVMEE